METAICAICGKKGIISAKAEEGGVNACTMVKVAGKRPFCACKEGHSKTAEGLSIQRYWAEKKRGGKLT